MSYINHVAVPVDDVDRASAFYVDWFGATVIPSPKFPVPVAWLMLGKIQVHLVQHPDQLSLAYHFAVAIENREAFEAFYWRAEREGILDTTTFPHHIFELPNGNVQTWIRDVSGNVVEVDYPDVHALDPAISGAASRWADDSELTEWNRRSSLFLPEQAGIAAESGLAPAVRS